MLRAHRRTHARIWRVLAILLPAVILVALVIRQNGPREAAPVQLAPPPAAVQSP